ncbi:MAG: N-acyl homoserine lactonase family protein [Terricaulis sp.]
MKRFAVLAILVAALAGCGQSAERKPPEIKLYAMECGRIHVTDADAFADDGSFAEQARDMVDPCYLIRHPDGDLLWDSGLPDLLNEQADGVTQGPFQLSMPTKLVTQLAQLDLAPGDIDFISLSHSHFDHLGNAALFASATWLVDPDERAHMFRPEARADAQFASYSALENFRQRAIEGDGDFDVFGDGSVIIVQAPGHTPGHTILRVNLLHAGPVLLTGDLWHMAESRARRTVPRFNTSREQTLASMDKAEALARATGALVVRQHVPQDFAGLPKFPEALN